MPWGDGVEATLWCWQTSDAVTPWDRAKGRSTRTFLLVQDLLNPPVVVDGAGSE